MPGDALPDVPSATRIPGRRSAVAVQLTLLALVLVSLVVSLGFGAERLPVRAVADVLRDRLQGHATSSGASVIVWELRLPRALLAVAVGAGLAVSGATIQTLAQNPLADPYLLGVSSGASVGATAVIAGGLGAASGRVALTTGALLGALAAGALVFAIAQLQGGLTPLRLVLTGTVLASAFSSLSSFLVFASGDTQSAQNVLFWLLGTLAGASWNNLALPLVTVAIGTTICWLLSGWLDALANGAELAATVGVPVHGLRISLFAIQAILVGVLVASAGGIGFVGLIVPHVARILVGVGHRQMIPAAAAAGALFMLWIDVATRVLVSPVEMPVSVVTGLIGAPIFLLLLGRRSYRFGVDQ